MDRLDKVLIFIPARGGSKSIPKKNIIDLNGYPLIYYVIKQAKNFLTKMTSLHSRIIISTDDVSIMNVVKQYDIEVPFLRPKELATDNSPTIDALLFTLNRLNELEGYSPDIIILMQPTSPFVVLKDIKNGYKTFKKYCNPVISVVKNEHPIEWSYRINEDYLKPIFDSEKKMRQKHLNSYRINGALYISDTKSIIKNNGFLADDLRYVIMPQERSIDIDSMWDLKVAKMLMRMQNNE